MWILIFFLIISVIFEGTLSFFPMTLSILLVIALIRNDSYVFLIAAVCGVLLDILLLRPVGITGVVFLLLLFLLFLYERKYEIQSFQFVFFASFLTGTAYLIIFRTGHLLIEALLTAISSTLLFIIIKRLTTPRLKKSFS